MSEIRPTGQCFDDALDFLVLVAKQDGTEAMQRLCVVHGICLVPHGPSAGTPFAHAWVEDGDQVWQGGVVGDQRGFYSVARDEFLALMHPIATTRYTAVEAVQENHRHNHFGPWVPEYQALCGNNRLVPRVLFGVPVSREAPK